MKNPLKVLLIIPPFTQLNTPYPSISYLKRFLNKNNISAEQVDLSIDFFLKIFSKEGLTRVFGSVESEYALHSKTYKLKEYYISTIDNTIKFLQGKDNMLAHRICSRQYLPEGDRFNNLDDDLHWAFGTMGIIDRAKYLATLYIEDLNDFINKHIDTNFTISRYAEKIAMSATDFKPIDKALNEVKKNILHEIYEELLININKEYSPDLLGISIPFPGNLFFALKTGIFFKTNSKALVTIGGGYINTELRNIKTTDIFKYIDFITLDDGEIPLLKICNYAAKNTVKEKLVRTFIKSGNSIKYLNNSSNIEPSFKEKGFPDYNGLIADNYLSFIEINNPMHRLWSDGFWNKMTLAHGCYWKKCSFCDTTLDYINNFEMIDAETIVNRIEKIISETGKTSFHFVDEAAPPALLKELAIELLKRNINISWWTNIRFEKNFTADICRLLAESGCIAVSGGLEVASDNILKGINKGVTIKQAAITSSNFTESGIMVHAYLMYGFPGQTASDTIDSLEIIRQLFLYGCIQSAFWHKFTLTVHSIISKNPEKFNIEITGPEPGNFAFNDLVHNEKKPVDHDKYYNGLNKAVYNFMHGIGLEEPVSYWFDFETPRTRHKKFLIESILNSKKDEIKAGGRILWIGNKPEINITGNSGEISFYNKTEKLKIKSSKPLLLFLEKITRISNISSTGISLKELKEIYKLEFNNSFEDFMKSKEWKILRKNRLLAI